jgi:hypothetical protein
MVDIVTTSDQARVKKEKVGNQRFLFNRVIHCSNRIGSTNEVSEELTSSRLNLTVFGVSYDQETNPRLVYSAQFSASLSNYLNIDKFS